jgi:acyl carrier protein
VEDLGLDSLDVVECVMMIEEEFSIELDDTQVELIKSPKDMIQFILH